MKALKGHVDFKKTRYISICAIRSLGSLGLRISRIINSLP